MQNVKDENIQYIRKDTPYTKDEFTSEVQQM